MRLFCTKQKYYDVNQNVLKIPISSLKMFHNPTTMKTYGIFSKNQNKEAQIILMYCGDCFFFFFTSYFRPAAFQKETVIILFCSTTLL